MPSLFCEIAIGVVCAVHARELRVLLAAAGCCEVVSPSGNLPRIFVQQNMTLAGFWQ